MADKKMIDEREPRPDAVYGGGIAFDDAFVAMDNPDDAEITQYGNGTSLVAEDNPDDMEGQQPARGIDKVDKVRY